MNSWPVSAFSGLLSPTAREARVAPRARPGRGIGRRVEVRVLVGRQRAVRRRGAVGAARLPAGLPVHLVAAEEGEADAGVAGGLDVGALLAGPVLVVAAGEDDLVVEQEPGVGGDVGLARVARVVAVALEEPDHLVLGVEQVRAAVVLRDRPVEGAVVGDRERGLVALRVARRARRGARVQAVAAVLVVGLPRRVGGPDEHVRVRRVVADDEGDLARAAVVVAYEPARCRRRRPRWTGPSTTPTRPSCRSRSAPSPSRSGRRAGSGAGSPSGGRWPAAGARRCPGSSPAGRCRCGRSRRST